MLSERLGCVVNSISGDFLLTKSKSFKVFIQKDLRIFAGHRHGKCVSCPSTITEWVGGRPPKQKVQNDETNCIDCPVRRRVGVDSVEFHARCRLLTWTCLHWRAWVRWWAWLLGWSWLRWWSWLFRPRAFRLRTCFETPRARRRTWVSLRLAELWESWVLPVVRTSARGSDFDASLRLADRPLNAVVSDATTSCLVDTARTGLCFRRASIATLPASKVRQMGLDELGKLDCQLVQLAISFFAVEEEIREGTGRLEHQTIRTNYKHQPLRESRESCRRESHRWLYR